MTEKETKILEILVNNISKDIIINWINITWDYWDLTLSSLINKKKINARLKIFNDIKFNSLGEFKIKEKRSDLIHYLKDNSPFFLFAYNKANDKMYYLDLQHSSRVHYPLSEEGYCYIKLYENYELGETSSILIANHLIKYNYDWKDLYNRYRGYINIISRGNNSLYKDISNLEESIYIYKSLNYVYSEQDITYFKDWKFVELINANIAWLKSLVKSEKKYWISNDLESFKDVKKLKQVM